MLVEFSVENFRSIANRQTLSLVASQGGEHRDTNVVVSDAPGTPDLLLGAAIYGANASGKSNLINAMELMRDFVLHASSTEQAKAWNKVKTFAFGADWIEKPTKFEAIFVQNGTRYQYGFEVTRERVVGEWLFAFPEGRSQKWFVRDEEWESPDASPFGSSLKGEKRTWQKATRTNALFLSTAVQLNSEQLTPVRDWFRRAFRTMRPNLLTPHFTARKHHRDEGCHKRLIDFMREADIGVSAIETDAHPVDTKVLDGLPSEVMEYFRGHLSGAETIDVRFLHNQTEGAPVKLDLEDESDGTQKLFAMAGPWIDVLKNGWTLIVDELDTSLHPILMRYLVSVFMSKKTNPNNAQLVFSTHDVSVLDRDILRRDQVWFVEKDSSQRTQIYPLTDFSPRKDENFLRGYLQGRYGAIPFVERA
jgi:AAA15 family ATPase/GTPase